MPVERLTEVVDEALRRSGPRLVIGLPLGLGKPNRLVNAFYRRAKADPSVRIEFVTALSLDPPRASTDLEQRFLEPFAKRHFGEEYPSLEFVEDLRSGGIPSNVSVSEFYLRPGDGLKSEHSQRHHISSNYTHVVRDLLDRGVNVVLQLVARREGEGEAGRYSLSCNPDLTVDLVERLGAQGRSRLFLVGQVHPELPFMLGDAQVDEDFFDVVLPSEATPHTLFAVPRARVGTQDYWVGLHASRLVADGGSLQIGIGALSDALVHALILRHRQNDAYREVLRSRTAGPSAMGGLDPFRAGLYGASEMFMDGFMHLYREGILTREVFEDAELQRRSDGQGLEEDHPRRGSGTLMDGAFFLGSKPFYEFLRELDPRERPRFRMNAVSRINQLYGGNEALEVLQRRRARFFNTCMMVTATGAAVSDGLEEHRVVSGVGGQYNFVAMAHAMQDGRSILMLRSTRESGGRTSSNVVWEYPHTTIPRHLRDVVVTEYGVADLRGRTDEECIRALVALTDRRFQDELVETAKKAGKLSSGWQVPERARANTLARLEAALAPHRAAGRFPPYPFGSDFTPVEERLVSALMRVKGWASRRTRLARAALQGRPDRFPTELDRMGLERPRGLKEHLYARVVAAALEAEHRSP